jgi:hypothetical protein
MSISAAAGYIYSFCSLTIVISQITHGMLGPSVSLVLLVSHWFLYVFLCAPCKVLISVQCAPPLYEIDSCYKSFLSAGQRARPEPEVMKALVILWKNKSDPAQQQPVHIVKIVHSHGVPRGSLFYGLYCTAPAATAPLATATRLLLPWLLLPWLLLLWLLLPGSMLLLRLLPWLLNSLEPLCDCCSRGGFRGCASLSCYYCGCSSTATVAALPLAAVPVAAVPPLVAAPVVASLVAAASVAAAFVTFAPVAAAPSVAVTIKPIHLCSASVIGTMQQIQLFMPLER